MDEKGKNGVATTIYMPMGLKKQYAQMCRARGFKNVSKRVCELIRQDIANLNGMPILMSEEGVRDLQGQLQSLDREADQVIKILEDHGVSNELNTLCTEEYGLTKNYSNVPKVIARLMTDSRSGKIEYSDTDVLHLINLLSLLSKKAALKKQLTEILTEVYPSNQTEEVPETETKTQAEPPKDPLLPLPVQPVQPEGIFARIKRGETVELEEDDETQEEETVDADDEEGDEWEEAEF
jgi:hypothetical protein